MFVFVSSFFVPHDEPDSIEMIEEKKEEKFISRKTNENNARH